MIFCGVAADDTCRYELLRVEHNVWYVDESIHPKLICCGLLEFHIDLSLGDWITLVPLSFNISHFLEYMFLWLGCRYEIFTMSFSFTSVIFLALIWAKSCIFVSWGFKVSLCIFSNLFSNYMLSFWNFLITSTCDFLSSSNFLRSSLCLLIQRFSSCLSKSFPSMSFVDCSVFRLLFNFLFFVTSVLLWFLNLKNLFKMAW